MTELEVLLNFFRWLCNNGERFYDRRIDDLDELIIIYLREREATKQP